MIRRLALHLPVDGANDAMAKMSVAECLRAYSRDFNAIYGIENHSFQPPH
jgi:hypothetical protein